jgi:hypothetical protein
MTFHDDPDLERRLRRIAGDPKPAVPDSVARYALQVVSNEGDSRMGFTHFFRRGLVQVVAVAGVVGAITVAILVANLVVSARNGIGASPSASTTPVAMSSTSPTATPTAATPTPSPTQSYVPTPGISAGPTLLGTSFTTPGITTGWTGFTWSGISDSSPLRTPITNVMQWSGGYVATASGPQNGPTRGLWTSPDGQTWTPVTSIDASAVFVSAAPGGMVAVAVNPAGPYTPGTVWTSSDGLVWHDAGMSDLPGDLVSIAGTKAGIVATVDVTALSGTGKSQTASGEHWVLFSADGVHWTPESAAGGIQAGASQVPHVQTANGRFFLMGVPGPMASRSGASRIVLVASTTSVDAILWSDDGRTWKQSAGSHDGFAETIEFGRDGMLLNTNYHSTPGGSGLARSSDGGKTWVPETTFGPLGVAPCTGECSYSGEGEIVSNGTYFLAVKTGGKNAWLSYDGHTWTPVAWTGGNPIAGSLVLLPRGVVAAQYGAAR